MAKLGDLIEAPLRKLFPKLKLEIPTHLEGKIAEFRKYAFYAFPMAIVKRAISDGDFVLDSQQKAIPTISEDEIWMLRYKLKLDALKHQGKTINETSRQLVGKSETADIISETDSGRQVQRYIRLTNLIPALLRYVDEGKIALTPAVALSYLYSYEQEILVEAMEYYDCTPSLSQALYLKGISQAGVLDETEVYKVMSEDKANQKEHISFSKDELRRFFPGGYSSKQMSDAIIKMLEARQRARENKGGDAR